MGIKGTDQWRGSRDVYDRFRSWGVDGGEVRYQEGRSGLFRGGVRGVLWLIESGMVWSCEGVMYSGGVFKQLIGCTILTCNYGSLDFSSK